MISTLLYLLPVIALIPCAVEDWNTRRVSGAALAVLAASYIPAAIYNFEIGIYATLGYWVLFAAPQITVWFILLIYGFISGRGGADRIVILLGALSPYGFITMVISFIFQLLAYIIMLTAYPKMIKFPFIVPYALIYIIILVVFTIST